MSDDDPWYLNHTQIRKRLNSTQISIQMQQYQIVLDGSKNTLSEITTMDAM